MRPTSPSSETEGRHDHSELRSRPCGDIAVDPAGNVWVDNNARHQCRARPGSRTPVHPRSRPGRGHILRIGQAGPHAAHRSRAAAKIEPFANESPHCAVPHTGAPAAATSLYRLKSSQLLPRQSICCNYGAESVATLTRSGSFHVNGAPVHAACSAQRICPKCPVPDRREHRLEVRLEQSLGAGKYSVSNLHCSTYGPPRPQRALEVRRTRARLASWQGSSRATPVDVSRTV